MCLGVFTILHYGNVDITINCIESLLLLDNIDKCKIIVLDNNSETNILKEIKSKYSKHDICVLEEKDNKGFTVGNNILYRKAKSYNPKFIALLNNDIVIKQKKFISVLLEIINENKYHVIGPDIYKPSTQEHQAPLYSSIPDINELDRYMEWFNDVADGRIVAKDHSKSYYKLHKICPEKIMDFYRRVKYGKNSEKNRYLRKIEDGVLLGSCIIATDKYIDEEDVMFEPDTGFYFEELLLALKCKTKGYKSLYTPKLKVIHKHAESARTNSTSYQEYMIRTAKRMKKAYAVYLECWQDNPWKR